MNVAHLGVAVVGVVAVPPARAAPVGAMIATVRAGTVIVSATETAIATERTVTARTDAAAAAARAP